MSKQTQSTKVAFVSRVGGDAESDGGVRIQAPFDKDYLAALKQAVPWSFRRWLPDLQVMAIAHPYEEAAIEVAARFFAVQQAVIKDDMSIAERFWSEPAVPGREFEPGLKIKERHVS